MVPGKCPAHSKATTQPNIKEKTTGTDAINDAKNTTNKIAIIVAA
jgi:hypothetical protein